MSMHSLENDPEYINLQIEMVRMQNWLIEKGKRLIIIFEGRDSAGKGGAIMRFIRFINPRFYKVVALDKPSEKEKGQWYFQRYIQHLPGPGEMVFFDRSWYNRAVVEPVMGFCTDKQYKLFMKQVLLFENMLIEDDCLLFKFWFSISAEEQKKRLDERKTNPLINWKLSLVDMEAQLKWDNYTDYKLKMLQNTSTEHVPWIVINGNDKDLARLEAIRYVLNQVPYDQKGLTNEKLDPNMDVITIYT